MSVNTKHSSLGASGAHRWMNCHGSVKAEAQYKAEVSNNFYADEGSAAHRVADHCLRNGTDAEIYLDKWFDPAFGELVDKQKHSSFIHVDDEMTEGVQTYLDYCHKLAKAARKKVELVEHTVDLSMLYPDMYGTLDYGLLNIIDRTLYITDFKYGAGYPVEVENNPQLKFYALGVLYDKLVRKHAVDKVVTTIVQPRARHVQGPIRIHEYEPHELIEFGGDLVVAAEKTQVRQPTFKAGDWCKFCRHHAHCLTAQEHALEQASKIFDNEDADHLGRLLDSTYVVEEWVRAVRKACDALLKKGEAPAGWEIGEGRANRKWAHGETAIVKVLSKRFHLKEEDIYKPKELRSPAQIEKMLPKDKRNVMLKLAMRPRGAPVLVRAGKGKKFADASSVFEEENDLL